MLGAHSSQLMMSTDSSEKWNSLITPRLTVTCSQISIIRNWQPRMKRSQCWRRKWKERIQSLLFVVRNPTFASTLRWRQKNDSLYRWCWGWAEHQNGSEHSCHLGLTLSLKNLCDGISLVVQWLRIYLPMQSIWFNPWYGKISHASGQLSSCTTITELAA